MAWIVLGEDVEFGRLRCFVAVAEERHFGRAATRLHFQPSHVSHQIRQLERDLGLTLFERTSRTVALTPPGELMLTHARSVLAALESMRRAAADLATSGESTFELRYSSGTGEFVAEVVAELVRCHPQLQIRLGSLTSLEVSEAVVSGTATIGIGYIAAPGLQTEQLLTTHLGLLFVSTTHPLAERTTVSLADLDNEPLIVPERELNPPLRDQLDRLFLAVGVRPRFQSYHFKASQDLSDLVRAGAGLSIGATEFSRESHLTKAIPIDGPVPSMPLYAIWRSGSDLAPIRAFLEAAQRVVAKTPRPWAQPHGIPDHSQILAPDL